MTASAESACPSCGKPVDALRARYVGVREGKVVAYCSEACQARGGEGATAAAAAKPAPVKLGKRARTPVAGTPVRRTPPAGLPAVPAEGAAAGEGGEVTARRRQRRMDSLAAREAWDWLDDEPAAPGGDVGGAEDADEGGADGEGAEAEAPTGARRGRRWLAVAAAAALAGGGYAVYRAVAAPGDAGAPLDAAPRADAGPAAPDAAPPPTPDERRRAALVRATEALREVLRAPAPAAGAPELRALAAAALARTGDADALAHLAEALAHPPGEQAKLDLAYQLARGGDVRGAAALAAALGGASRDARLEAAQRLARLGDPRGAPVLRAAMAYSQFRITAAAELAAAPGAPDPAAVRALEQVLADPATNPDERARATIALGRARRADPEALRALLADKRNAAAAPVLAELGNPTARPVLYEQLGFEHVRVEAARALRRFGSEADVLEGLRALERALDAEAGAARLRAAEALLLLAGPAAWSERP